MLHKKLMFWAFAGLNGGYHNFSTKWGFTLRSKSIQLKANDLDHVFKIHQGVTMRFAMKEELTFQKMLKRAF